MFLRSHFSRKQNSTENHYVSQNFFIKQISFGKRIKSEFYIIYIRCLYIFACVLIYNEIKLEKVLNSSRKAGNKKNIQTFMLN